MSAPDVFADSPPPFRLGRTRSDPALIAASPQFRRHLVSTFLPAPPASVDYGPAAAAALRLVYLNDRLGDCVIAKGYHFRGVSSGNAGNLLTFTDAQVQHDYSAVGGYVPGRPGTDQGCDPQTALRYWMKTGFVDGNKLLGFLAVNPLDREAMETAVWLFENLDVALELPDAYVNPFPSASGFVWDVAGPPVPENGHSILAYGYNEMGLLISTWGMTGTMTWAAVAKYLSASTGGELYAMLDQEIVNRAQGKAPNGFDWPTLVSDFDALGGNVPVPPSPNPQPPSPPTPPVPPSPVPGGLMTLDILKADLAKLIQFVNFINGIHPNAVTAEVLIVLQWAQGQDWLLNLIVLLINRVNGGAKMPSTVEELNALLS